VKVGLGTVQFGLDYGISNPRGQVPEDEVARILQVARRAGVQVLDTAFEYGSSEEVLGRHLTVADRFRIVTKTPGVRSAHVSTDDARRLRTSFLLSLKRLGRAQVYGLLAHHAPDLLAEGGQILYAEMAALKREGLVQKIGASVYTGRQLDALLSRFAIDLVQLPLNVLDQRLLADGTLGRLRAAGVEIHARSVFLQGLLLMEPGRLDTRFSTVKDHLSQYHAFLGRAGVDPVRAALGFVASVPEVDQIIVGVVDAEQLQQVLDAAARPPLDASELACFAWHDESILDPSRWRPAREITGQACA